MSDLTPRTDLVFRVIAAARGVCDMDEPDAHMPIEGRVAGLSRESAVLLIVGSCFDELIRRGLITGEPIVTPIGADQLIELAGVGFEPTEYEIVSAARWMLKGAK